MGLGTLRRVFDPESEEDFAMAPQFGSRSAAMVALQLMAMGLIGAGATGCMGMPGPRNAPPALAGAHAVGVVTIGLTDDARDRSLEVEVWYPARPHTGTPKRMYRLKGAAGMTVARLRSPLSARRAARLDPAGGPHPVVLLSHGATSSRLAHVGLAEVLASHGYIVAAPDHRGHTMADKLGGVSLDQRARAAFDRPLDLSRTLDELIARAADRTSIFHAGVDATRVAVAGHSFGGRTALGLVGARFNGARQARECQPGTDDRRCHALPVFGPTSYRYHDARVKAALLIAPSGFKFYRGDGVANVTTPTLVVGARNDRTTPYDVHHGPIFASLRGPRYLLDLDRAGHLTATDVCAVVRSVGFLARLVGGDEARDGCGEDYMTPAAAMDRLYAAALPFLDLHLNGNADAEASLQSALMPPAKARPVRVAAAPRRSKL
ncbi:MAG: alpha/beta hydrolase [Myxococcota bacterium]